MKTTHNSFLLFIEPNNLCEKPIIDVYTRKITGAFHLSKLGGSGYTRDLPHFAFGVATKGWHSCSCGAISSNCDYLLPTKELEFVELFSDSRSFFNVNKENSEMVRGLITNSLCIHYVACHRSEISQEVLNRILLLEGEEVEPDIKELQAH